MANRTGLQLVKGQETLTGEGAVLDLALAVSRKLRQDGVGFEVVQYETHPGVQCAVHLVEHDWSIRLSAPALWILRMQMLPL